MGQLIRLMGFAYFCIIMHANTILTKPCFFLGNIVWLKNFLFEEQLKFLSLIQKFQMVFEQMSPLIRKKETRKIETFGINLNEFESVKGTSWWAFTKCHICN